MGAPSPRRDREFALKASVLRVKVIVTAALTRSTEGARPAFESVAKRMRGSSAEAIARRVSAHPETPQMQMQGYAVAAATDARAMTRSASVRADRMRLRETVTMPCRRAPMPPRPQPPPCPAAHQFPYDHLALGSSGFAPNAGEQGHQVTRAVSAMSPASAGKRPSALPIRCVTWLAGQGAQRAWACAGVQRQRQGQVRRGPGPGGRAGRLRRQLISDRSAAPATRRARLGSRPLSPIELRRFRMDDGYETRPTVENQPVRRTCVHRATALAGHA